MLTFEKNQFLLFGLLITILLATISPNLIATIGLLPFLVYCLINIKFFSIYNFNFQNYIFFTFVIVFSFINYSFFNSANDLFFKSTKAFLLILPFLLIFNYSEIVKKSLITDKFIKILFIISTVCALLLCFQLFSKDLIKNILQGEHTTIYELSAKTNNFLNAFVVFVWCYLIIIKRVLKKIYFLPVLIFSITILVGHSLAAKITLIFSISIFLLFFITKDKALTILKIIIILLVMSFFILPNALISNKDNTIVTTLFDHLDQSTLHRLDIWDKNIELIRKKPILGWGTSNGEKLVFADETTFFNNDLSRNHFFYSHNIFLQITLELGLIGLFILLWQINYLLNSISKYSLDIQPYVYAMFIAALSIWMFSIPIWRSWWLIYLAIITLFVFVSSKNKDIKTFK